VRDAFLSDKSWANVIAPLAQPSKEAAAERLAIAATVGLYEAASRRHIAVGPDYAGTYVAALQKNQNDCVDETANTTTLLLTLKDAGLLRRLGVASLSTVACRIVACWSRRLAAATEALKVSLISRVQLQL
jgi:hypothetical protein